MQQISGERLQDHWSSGFLSNFDLIFSILKVGFNMNLKRKLGHICIMEMKLAGKILLTFS